MRSPSSLALLGKKRFLPLFVTQLLGAFNDNLFKQALVLAILYRIGSTVDANVLVNLSALLFILPFFLFSALGGQFGERFEKSRLIRALKLWEVAIMTVGALAMWFAHLPLLLLVLFCMGTQSALFGPVKYSILPQVLDERELMAGNGLVEMGTFLAILGGTLVAGLLMSSERYAILVAASVLAVALAGYLASRQIPLARAPLPELALDWHILRQTRQILRLGFGQHRSVSRAMIGNSWFWFLGATYLTQIPAFAKGVLNGNETAVTLILSVFSIGIASGSMLCARLSARKVEIGLVPLGALGVSLCGVLLWWHASTFSAAPQVLGAWGLLAEPGARWILLDIFGLGLFGGIYIVPLYALIQSRSPEHQRARVVAANNILNALFMVCSAILAILLLAVVGLSIAQLFLVVSLFNLLLAFYLFRAVPEFLLRCGAWLLGRTRQRVRGEGGERIPAHGAALLLARHERWVEVLLIGGAMRRPVHFFTTDVLSPPSRLLRICGVSALDGEDVQLSGRVAGLMAAGELVCLLSREPARAWQVLQGRAHGLAVLEIELREDGPRSRILHVTLAGAVDRESP
ncbi:MFS transporter [Stutzerimonas kirkiae]|uniref:MFS transporter n=1 Tax=Stutzerimonas kirkiae TaxID=2211392 RepID=UPI001038476A|nr:MFS transporter [Stutzerimonas kirkiae]TBV11130.1 glycerol acyltransferase [Stutzerimonas kirkiae]